MEPAPSMFLILACTNAAIISRASAVARVQFDLIFRRNERTLPSDTSRRYEASAIAQAMFGRLEMITWFELQGYQYPRV